MNLPQGQPCHAGDFGGANARLGVHGTRLPHSPPPITQCVICVLYRHLARAAQISSLPQRHTRPGCRPRHNGPDEVSFPVDLHRDLFADEVILVPEERQLVQMRLTKSIPQDGQLLRLRRRFVGLPFEAGRHADNLRNVGLYAQVERHILPVAVIRPDDPIGLAPGADL